MNKRDNGVLGKMIIGVVLTFSMLFVSGCSDSSLEKENIRLKNNIVEMKRHNRILEVRLKITIKDLAMLRENNKGLNISLAKSELEFFKKHKEELKKEREKLDNEKKEFKKKQKIIEKEAYKSAKNTMFNTYIGVFVVIVMLFVLVLILWFLSNRKNKTILREKEIEKEKLISKNEENEKKLKNKEKIFNDLEGQIKDLERMQKAGSINQVLRKLEEYESKREQKMNSLKGNNYGN